MGGNRSCWREKYKEESLRIDWRDLTFERRDV